MASRVITSVPAGVSIPRCSVRCHQRKERAEIRSGFLRKLKREATRFVRKRSGITRKKPLKKVARSRRRELAEYFAISTNFLLRPENALCLICTVRREHGENIFVQVAKEVHHYAGRIGRLLCYVPFFKPSCRGCRDWPHQNQTKAREWGLLAPAPQWNVFPRNAASTART